MTAKYNNKQQPLNNSLLAWYMHIQNVAGFNMALIAPLNMGQ